MMFFHKKNRYELDMTTANNALQNIPVSYTHLDVYKRQHNAGVAIRR